MTMTIVITTGTVVHVSHFQAIFGSEHSVFVHPYKYDFPSQAGGNLCVFEDRHLILDFQIQRSWVCPTAAAAAL